MRITEKRLLEIIQEEIKKYSLNKQRLIVESEEQQSEQDDQTAAADYAIAGLQAGAFAAGTKPGSAVLSKIAPAVLKAAPRALKGLAITLNFPMGLALAAAPYLIQMAGDANKNPRIRPASEGKAISGLMKMVRAINASYNESASKNFEDLTSKDARDVMKFINQLNSSLAQIKKINNRELPPAAHFRSLRKKYGALFNQLKKRESQAAQGAIVKKDAATPKKAKKTKKVTRKPKATRRVKNTTAGSVEKNELRKQLRVAFREMKKAAKDAGKDNWRKLRYSHPKRVAVRNIYKQLRA